MIKSKTHPDKYVLKLTVHLRKVEINSLTYLYISGTNTNMNLINLNLDYNTPTTKHFNLLPITKTAAKFCLNNLAGNAHVLTSLLQTMQPYEAK